MTAAAFWQSIVTPMVPEGTPLVQSKRARMLLNEASVWQGEAGFTGYAWRFSDLSTLCADQVRDWVVAGREVVR